MCCWRDLITFWTHDKFLSCNCQKWRLPVGPYQIQQIHFLSRYRSHAGGGYYSVCLSACDFLLWVRSGCFASSACCLLPPVPSLPGHILLFLCVDRNSWSMRGSHSEICFFWFWLVSSQDTSASDVGIWKSPIQERGYSFLGGGYLALTSWKSEMLNSDMSGSVDNTYRASVYCFSAAAKTSQCRHSRLCSRAVVGSRALGWEDPVQARLTVWPRLARVTVQWVQAAAGFHGPDAHNAFFMRH